MIEVWGWSRNSKFSKDALALLAADRSYYREFAFFPRRYDQGGIESAECSRLFHSVRYWRMVFNCIILFSLSFCDMFIKAYFAMHFSMDQKLRSLFGIKSPSSMPCVSSILIGTSDFASELQKNLQKALPFENLAVDECAKHLKFFSLKVTGSTPTQRKLLDKQGTTLWNLCRNSDGEETEAAANARCHGSFIVLFNLRLR